MAEILIGNVKGPQGDTGATGATGPQGEAATVNVGSVSTTAYGNAAQVINVGTENDAILNFIIPQGKPGERTTTMGSLTLDTITTSTADFPSPQVGDTGATAFGKIVKFFADALSAIQAKLDAANVVNNLTTTESGYALDARQGNALRNSLSALGWYTLYEDHSVRSTDTTVTLILSRKLSDYDLLLFLFRDANKSYIRMTGIAPLSMFTETAWEGTYVNSTGTQFWVDCGRVSDTQIKIKGSANAVGGFFTLIGIKLHTA